MSTKDDVLEGEVLAPEITTTIEEYSPTAAALTALSAKYKGKSYETSTVVGMKAATVARAEIRGLRVALEKKRKEIKAEVLDKGRRIDSEAARITEALEALETPIDSQIKAEEARKEVERQAKLVAGFMRVETIQANIQGIRDYAASLNSMSKSSEIAEKIEMAKAIIIDDTYAEFQLPAQNAREATIRTLETMYTDCVAFEERAARMAAEREELDRLRAEQTERDRIAEEKRVAEQAERDRLDREREEKEKTEKKRISGIQAKLTRLRNGTNEAVVMSSWQIAQLQASYEVEDIDASAYDEFTEEALALKRLAIIALKKLHADTVAREEAAAKLKADQDAHEARVKADQKAHDDRIRAEKEEKERLEREALEKQAAEDRLKAADASKQAKADADKAAAAEVERKAAEKRLKLEAAKRGSLEEALREIQGIATEPVLDLQVMIDRMGKIALIAEANLATPDEKKIKSTKRGVAR